MKSFLCVALLLLSGIISSGDPSFLDPTGTYILKGEVKNNKIISHYGELRVQLLNSHAVALCFYINNGYPDYDHGSMLDTLRYEDQQAIYTPPGDSSCSIFFEFDFNSAKVSVAHRELHSACGFHPGVLVPALLEKTSSEIPVIQDLSGRGNP
jgi:hypothetical protein